MPETTIQEAATATAAPSFNQADVQAAVAAALEADRAARRTAKAAKAAKKAKAAESAKPPAAPVAETVPAAPQGQPDIEQLVAQGITAALTAQGLTETTEQKITRLVEEGVTRAKQEMTAAGGGPGRKGLVTEHTAKTDGMPADYPVGPDGAVLPMEKWSEAQRRAVGTVLQQTFLGSRAEL